MKKILFICHGNICRSPMAEFVMKDIVKKAGLEKQFQIDSAAACDDALGCGIHRGTRTKLSQMGVPFEQHYARKLTRTDGEYYDLLIAMDNENLFYMKRIVGKSAYPKIHLLLEYAGLSGDIADPWYTGNFDDTYNDIDLGCRALLHHLQK